MQKSMEQIGIGELSQRTNCNVETIRYYEKIAILNKPDRTSGGHRVYGEVQIKRLSMILKCRQLGFAIEEIRGLLSLVDGGIATCAEVKHITEGQLSEVQRKMADLKKMEKTLKNMVAQCSGSKVPECPVLDVLYAA